MKCEVCGQEDTVDVYQFPTEDTEHRFCADHAIENGFCYICGYFSAGMESYDFSPLKGVCGECVDVLRDEAGEYDDPDEYFDM